MSRAASGDQIRGERASGAGNRENASFTVPITRAKNTIQQLLRDGSTTFAIRLDNDSHKRTYF